MGWAIVTGHLCFATGNARGGRVAVFIDTTTDRAFGPRMRDRREAQNLASYVGGDPRMLTESKLEKQLLQYREEGSPQFPVPRVMRVRHRKRRSAR